MARHPDVGYPSETVACKGEDGSAAELAAVAGDEEGTHLRREAGAHEAPLPLRPRDEAEAEMRAWTSAERRRLPVCPEHRTARGGEQTKAVQERVGAGAAVEVRVKGACMRLV